MPRQNLVLNDFSGGFNNYQNPRDLQLNEMPTCQGVTFVRRNSIESVGSFATHKDDGSSSMTQAATISGGYGLFSFETDYSPISYEAVDTSQSTNIYFDNGNGDGDSGGTIVGTISDADHVIVSSDSNSGLLDTIDTSIVPGNQIKISGTVKNNGIYTVRAVGDSVSSRDLDDGGSSSGTANIIVVDETSNSFSAEVIAANATTNGAVSVVTHTLGENLLILSDVANGNLDAYTKSNNTFNNAQITTMETITTGSAQSPEYGFYSVDNATRVSDGKISPNQSVQWYGFISRHHFKGVQHSSTDLKGSNTLFRDFYSKDNKLSPPTFARTATSDTYPSSNIGFSVNYDSTNSNTNSTWFTETFKIALSFIYDGNQESLLYIPTSNNTLATVSGNDLQLRVMAKIGTNAGYDPRITGGRMYIKPADIENDPWTLLFDVNLETGVSGGLFGDKTGWTASSAQQVYSDITLLNPNIDTYESINGYPPDVNSNSIGLKGEGWKSGVIANRRAFVANVRIKNEYDNNISAHGDRIMYSMPNKFDTFPSFNFIDVVKGDAEAYLKVDSYADRLLCFKHHSVQIVNVSSPSDANWFLEDNIKNNGVAHPAAVFNTSKGIVWANNKGFFLYNGSSIQDLTSNKINGKTWDFFITDYSIVGYDARSQMAMVIRDSENSGANQGDAYMYDFKTGAWSFVLDLLTASAGSYTNFITDYNGNLAIGVQSSSNILIKEFQDYTLYNLAVNDFQVRTKDIDFGLPSVVKKIYSVTVTYKSDNAQTQPIKYALDGGTSYTALNGNFIATSNNYKVLKATPSSILSCESISIQIVNPTNASGSSSGVQINDISIEYRVLRNKLASSDT